MKQLRTEIIINAPVSRVWEILTDFNNYPEWNPFIKSFNGEVREGSRFKVTIHPPDGSPMTFNPMCLALKKDSEFRWLGHLFFKGLFDGEHIFELESLDNGTTHFVQRENFRGILVPLLWGSLEDKTRRGFEAMNEALKVRAEG